MNTTTETALRALDPARTVDLTGDTARRRRDAMLDRVLAASQTGSQRHASGAAPRLGRRLLAIAAAAAVVTPVAVLGAHLAERHLAPSAQGLTRADLASWTSASTPLPAARLSEAAKRWCRTATDRQFGSDAPVRILGGEERGQVASMLLVRGDATDICLANTAGGGGYWELVTSTSTPLPAVQPEEVLLQSEGEHGSNDVGTAWGQAGRDVTALTLHFGGRDVQTTVVGGIWQIWWPAATIEGLPTTATITLADGTTRTVPVRTP